MAAVPQYEIVYFSKKIQKSSLIENGILLAYMLRNGSDYLSGHNME
jgi:hypothetical protein